MEPRSEKRRSPRFELIAGNLALDFINTLDNRPSPQPKELLTNYSDLAAFAQQTGILTPAQFDSLLEDPNKKKNEAQQVMRRAIHLREALYAIFSAVMKKQTAPPAAMDMLNAHLHDAALHAQLVQLSNVQLSNVHRGNVQPRVAQPAAAFAWHFDDVTSSREAMLRPIARAARDLLLSPDVAQVRACSAPNCRWFFLDTSKNHHRRWCDMKVCGNRAKARKFYARKRTA